MSADQICLNPWDVQSHRIYSPDGTYHCLFSADRSGQMTDGVVYAIDQQGRKGGANYSKDIMPSILSDSHGTPHAVCFQQNQRNEVRVMGQQCGAITSQAGMHNQNFVCYRKSTKPGNGAVETWVQDDITNTLNGYEFHSPVRTPEVVVYDARGNGEGG